MVVDQAQGLAMGDRVDGAPQTERDARRRLRDRRRTPRILLSGGRSAPSGGAGSGGRITEVYVKEGGKWKTRAAHYSPIAAGSGTNQTAID